MTNYFNVIGMCENTLNLNSIATTLHFSADRTARHNRIISVVGAGNLLYSFEVDRMHPNGNEIHSIFDNGIVVITNKRTGKLVTELIARPAQIKRYWNGCYPAEIASVLAKAASHERNGWNNW